MAQIAEHPEALRDQAVLSRGWVVDAGQTAEGLWVELAVSKAALARVQDHHSAPGDTALLLLPAGGAPDLFGDLHGKELEMLIRVEQRTTLADGRTAVRAFPLQVAAMTRFGAPAQREIPSEALESVKEAGKRQRRAAGFFRDPNLPSSRTREPVYRVTFLDEKLRRPFWYLPGPVTTERTGSPAAPEYRFASLTRSEDGHSKEAVCAFRVEDRFLRNIAYDETVRDPSGVQVSAQHFDFVSGTMMDKVTGVRRPWPENIYAPACLGFALAGYPFDQQRNLSFFIWSEYEPTAPMDAVLDGVEQVTVPAGTFDCYRIRMNVDTERMMQRLVLPSEQAYALARGVAEQMRPADSVMWLTTAWPHVVIKTEGPMGPPGTSPAVMELVDMEPQTRAAIVEGSTPPGRGP